MSDKQTSLTAPADKTQTEHTPETHAPLNDEQCSKAYKECFVNSLTELAYERKYADPGIVGQKYSLHSFIPSKGATPDNDGIYGMIKIRGTFATVEESNEKAADLIRNHDSYHKIYHGFVGRPMPLTVKSDWSRNVEEIDIQKQVSKIIREDVKEKRSAEKKQVEEIREREKNLRDAVEQESTDPYERYTMLRVKRAQIIWGYLEHRKKIIELEDVFTKTLAEIKEMDEEDDDYSKKYMDRYMDARKQAGIPNDDNSFMQFLDTEVDDIELYAKKHEELAKSDDPNYKVNSTGSTITIARQKQDHDDEFN